MQNRIKSSAQELRDIHSLVMCAALIALDHNPQTGYPFDSTLPEQLINLLLFACDVIRQNLLTLGFELALGFAGYPFMDRLAVRIDTDLHLSTIKTGLLLGCH